MNSVDNIERHLTSTALSLGAITCIATAGYGYWIVREAEPIWQRALGASLAVVPSLGVATYLETISRRVRDKLNTTLELSDQIEVQQTWMSVINPPESAEVNEFNMAKPEKLPEITWNDFVKNVINKPEVHPHIGVFGSTGTGKTLLAEAIGDYRAHYHQSKGKTPRRVYLSPTCDTVQKEFLGWELVGQGFDGKSISDFGEYLRTTLKERYTESDDSYEPILVAPDEYRWTTQNEKTVPTVIAEVLSIGRKRNLEIILISPSFYVKALGMEGEGDLRNNMVMVLKGKLMLDRVAVLEKDGLFPKGSVQYLSRILDAHPYSVTLVDDKVLILPDMAGYREAKSRAGITYMNEPDVLTPPTVDKVHNKKNRFSWGKKE